MPSSRQEALEALQSLQEFIPLSEWSVLNRNCKFGEEKQYFRDMVVTLKKLISTMPKTMGQDGKGDNAIAYLHYFHGGFDWYITEKDSADPQYQAFGLAHLFEAELGYISIVELVESGVELDLHWTPKTIGEIKKEHGW